MKVSFKYINNDQKVYGLIAQEVEPYYPDMVFTQKNGKKLLTTINLYLYSFLKQMD